MDDLRALFAQTAELAAGFYDSLDDRAVFPRATVDEVRAALRRAAARGADARAAGDRGAGRGRRSRARRGAERPLLRFRDRRRGAGVDRGRLADLDMGSERRPLRRRPGRLRRRGGRRRVADRAARAAAARVVRLRDRRADGDVHRARRGAPPCAEAHGLGRRARRADRRAANPRRRRREAPRHDRPRAPHARARRPDRHRRRGLERTHAHRRAAADGRADDRLRAGRRGQHGRLRPFRPARGRDATPLRTRGCTSTVRSGSGRPSPPRYVTSSRASSAPTRGRSTRTSG